MTGFSFQVQIDYAKMLQVDRLGFNIEVCLLAVSVKNFIAYTFTSPSLSGLFGLCSLCDLCSFTRLTSLISWTQADHDRKPVKLRIPFPRSAQDRK